MAKYEKAKGCMLSNINGTENHIEVFDQAKEIEILLVENIEGFMVVMVNNLCLNVSMTAISYDLGPNDRNEKSNKDTH